MGLLVIFFVGTTFLSFIGWYASSVGFLEQEKEKDFVLAKLELMIDDLKKIGIEYNPENRNVELTEKFIERLENERLKGLN